MKADSVQTDSELDCSLTHSNVLTAQDITTTAISHVTAMASNVTTTDNSDQADIVQDIITTVTMAISHAREVTTSVQALVSVQDTTTMAKADISLVREVSSLSNVAATTSVQVTDSSAIVDMASQDREVSVLALRAMIQMLNTA